MKKYYNNPEFSSEQWKRFGMDTEAGRMINKLYATNAKPKINYPPLRLNNSKNSTTASRRKFIPAGGKLNVDPRTNRILKVDIERPKVGQGKKLKPPAPIDLLRGRKSKAAIEIMNKTREFDVNCRRGQARKPISTDHQKRMLQMSNQFYGGKILPDAGSYIKVDENIPLHVVTGNDKARAFHLETLKKHKCNIDANNIEKGKVEKLREDFEYTMEQIEEDEKFMKELEHDGSRRAKEQMRIIMAQTAEHLRRAKELDSKIKAITAE